MRIWIALLALVLLAGCARASLDAGADRTARDFYAAVQAGDWPRAEAHLGPAMARPDRTAGLQEVRRALPGGPPREARSVGWTPVGRQGVSAVHLYRFAQADVVVSTVLQPTGPGGRMEVAGFVANRLAPGVLETNKFGVSGRSARHYGFLASAMLSPLVMGAVALMAATTRGLRFKLGWIALALVGVGSAWINWATGEGGFTWAQIGLVNVGFGRATEISPWIIRFSMPVGALLVLARLLTLKDSRASPPPGATREGP
jgi:hypothetical protein